MIGIHDNRSVSQYSDQTSRAAGAEATGFAEVYQAQTQEQDIKDLENKYGVSIGVQSIPKDHKSIEKYVLGSGCKEITLAPNIVERMYTNPSYGQKIEEKIAGHISRSPKKHGKSVPGRPHRRRFQE